MAALAAVDELPALIESRERLLTATRQEHVLTSELVATIESDVALLIRVLRLAAASGRGGHVESAVHAVQILPLAALRRLAETIETFDFFDRGGAQASVLEQFRLHALSTQQAAARLAVEISYPERDRLMVTSLLHDVGKLVLIHAYPVFRSHVNRDMRTPEERIYQERRELGLDHAPLGGVLIRRWGLSPALAIAIEHHHKTDAEGESALIRLADMIAHHVMGGQISSSEMLATAAVIGVEPGRLRRIIYEMSTASQQPRREVAPSPLSKRELAVLKRVADGKLCKEIAHELRLSPSTIRSHLHKIYPKLGAVDRAQAVLVATQRGWL